MKWKEVQFFPDFGQCEINDTQRDGKKYVQRLVPYPKPRNNLILPESRGFAFVNPPTKTISDIQILPAGKLEMNECNVEIAVETTGPNFRDLLVVIQAEEYDFKGQPMGVGLDIAGIVASVGVGVKTLKVGDAVFGFTLNGGICSHISVPEQALKKIRKNMTFTGAATIPCAFLTAYYAFVEIAKIS